MAKGNHILSIFRYYAQQLNASILFYPKIFIAIRITSASYMRNVLLDVFRDFCFTHCYLAIYRAEFIVRMVQMMHGIVMVTTKSISMVFQYMVELMDFQGRFYG